MNSLLMKHAMCVGPCVTAWLSILFLIKRLEQKLATQQNENTAQTKTISQPSPQSPPKKLLASKFTETCDDFLMLKA